MISQYKQEVSKYGKKDAIIALCFFVYICVVNYALMVLSRLTSLGDIANTLIAFGFIVVPCFAIVMLKKQSIASIGIHTKNLWSALGIGAVLAALILLLRAFIPGLVEGWEFHPLNHVMLMLFFTVALAIMEDIVFSGYIQTRIYGLIKNDIAAVLIVGFLFALIHVVAYAGLFGISDFSIASFSTRFPFWIGMHIIYNLVFRRRFSIFPVIMVHTAWNFSNMGIFVIDGGSIFINISFYVLLSVMVIWTIVAHLRMRKTSREQLG